MTIGREGERDCPEPARYRYQTPTKGPYRFCEEHAAYCATLPLVELS